jgi:hypothetical protein
MTANKREEGYYWVKLQGEDIVAEWDPEFQSWYITGQESSYYDRLFDEIDERRITRSTPKEDGERDTSK